MARLDEIKKLQKIAGILKENSDQWGLSNSSEPGANIILGSRDAIIRMNALANEYGFEPKFHFDPEKELNIDNQLPVMWTGPTGAVELKKDPKSGLIVNWADLYGEPNRGTDPVTKWMETDGWEEHFAMAPDDSGDELDDEDY